MIVTCPSCEAKYRVDAAALEARRGKVKCASCAHVWTVEDEALTLSQPFAAPEIDSGPAPAPEPVAEAAPEPAPSIRTRPHAAIRAREDAKRRNARLAAEGAGWLGVAACFTVLIAAAVVFRVDVVDVWPRTAGAYAAVGLEVNPHGVEIENLAARFDTTTSAGTVAPTLIVSGALRNITGEDRAVPPLEAVAYDAAGTVLYRWPVAVEAASLATDTPTTFETTLQNPPEGAVRVEVVVVG